MPKDDLIERLSPAERKRYKQAETRIEKAMASFVVAGQELAAIRDEKLYREKYGTFAEYCEQRWDMQRRHAYRLIDSAAVMGRLECVQLDTLPATESQARPLTTIDLEKVGDAWAFVVPRLPEDDMLQPILTAKAIEEELQVWKDNEAAVPLTEEEFAALCEEDANRIRNCVNPKCDSTDFDIDYNCLKCGQSLLPPSDEEDEDDYLFPLIEHEVKDEEGGKKKAATKICTNPKCDSTEFGEDGDCVKCHEPPVHKKECGKEEGNGDDDVSGDDIETLTDELNQAIDREWTKWPDDATEHFAMELRMAAHLIVEEQNGKSKD